MALAVLNGVLRDWIYGPHTGELAAHQISTVLLVVFFACYFRLLQAVWPLRSTRQAWAIGMVWMAMTLAFEVGLGRLVLGHPWSRILHEYDLVAGRVWVLIPLWVLVGPYVIHRFRRAR